jgi:transposase
MSLKLQAIGPIPEQTVKVAKAAFPNGNTYMKMRDELGVFFSDDQFADLFSSRGQPALSPWRLALVTIMQYAENLTDRQTADAVRARIDWKYALGLDLADPGFNYSVLSEFRDRLIQGEAEQLLLEKMLSHFKDKGLLKSKGKQRTDSTHVLAKIRTLNRLELVAETMIHTLNVLIRRLSVHKAKTLFIGKRLKEMVMTRFWLSFTKVIAKYAHRSMPIAKTVY